MSTNYWPTTVTIRRDFDGKWASTWPADIVRNGQSAGAGRHETQRGLVAAIRAKGYAVERDGRTLIVSKIERKVVAA